MIGSLGMPELLFILVLALLIFGPRKLPDIGRTMGKAMGEFRRATRDLKRTLDTELSAEEASRPANPAQVTPAPAVPACSTDAVLLSGGAAGAPDRNCISGNNMGYGPYAVIDHTQIPGDVATVTPG